MYSNELIFPFLILYVDSYVYLGSRVVLRIGENDVISRIGIKLINQIIPYVLGKKEVGCYIN